MDAYFSADSFAHVSAFPGASEIESSDAIGWKSLLVTHSRVDISCTQNDTVSTPDQIFNVITSGSGKLELLESGIWRESFFRPGTIYLAGSLERFRYRWDARPAVSPVERLHVFFADEMLAEAAEHFRRAGQHTPRHSVSALAVKDDTLERVGSALLSAMRTGLPDIYAEATSQWLSVHLLAAHSAAIHARDQRSPGKLIDSRLARAMDYVQSNLRAPLDLASMAKEAGISKFHFNRLFRQALGVTPIQFLFNRRADHAARLLMRVDVPVHVVATESGFTNASHFNRVFRQRFGISPTHYRQARRRAADVRDPDFL